MFPCDRSTIPGMEGAPSFRDERYDLYTPSPFLLMLRLLHLSEGLFLSLVYNLIFAEFKNTKCMEH